MIPEISFTFLLLILTTAASVVTLPEITSYAKVSRNGQETKKTIESGPFSWIARAFAGSNFSTTAGNEGRSVKDIAITVSPVYVPPRTPKLKNGEAVDYPSTKRYSTIDKELLEKLDETRSKIQIQERFHPPASFEHNAKPVSSSPPMSTGPDSIPVSPSSSNIFGHSRPVYSGTYLGFEPSNFDKPKDYLSDKPISKPIGIDSYPAIVLDKPSEPYKSQLDSYPNQHDDTDFTSYSSGPSYDDHAAPKPIQFDESSFDDDSYTHDHGHYHHHEVIYDHLPEYHHPSTTPEPEMNDQRLDKQPYSYYFIGKKLWYIPLYFSIYFIIYIAALVLKSIARHKIAFPAHLAEAAGNGRMDTGDPAVWWDLTNRVFGGMERFVERFGKES